MINSKINVNFYINTFRISSFHLHVIYLLVSYLSNWLDITFIISDLLRESLLANYISFKEVANLVPPPILFISKIIIYLLPISIDLFYYHLHVSALYAN